MAEDRDISTGFRTPPTTTTAPAPIPTPRWGRLTAGVKKRKDTRDYWTGQQQQTGQEQWQGPPPQVNNMWTGSAANKIGSRAWTGEPVEPGAPYVPPGNVGTGKYAPVPVTHGQQEPTAGYTQSTIPLPAWSTKRSPSTFGQFVNNPPTTPYLTWTPHKPEPLPVPAPIRTEPTYSPFASYYDGWGKGRGGGGGGWTDYTKLPSWIMNLYSWTFKG